MGARSIAGAWRDMRRRFRRRVDGGRCAKGGRAREGLCLRLEPLEDRQMLSVAPWDLGPAWASGLALEATAGAAQAAAAGDDYRNTMDSAASASVSTWYTSTKYGSIEVSGDVDMFRFVSPVSGWVTVTQNARYGSAVDPHLYVYNAGQSLVAEDDDSGSGLNSRLEIPVTAGAAYYVAATSHGASAGKYTLGLKATRDDHADTFAAATTLSLSSSGSASKTGKIERTGDTDVFRFVARVSGTMTITQSAYYSSLDPYLCVYNGSEQLLAGDDDSGGGLNSRVVIDVTAGSTYYVRAGGIYGTSGSYVLRLSTAASTSGDDFGNTFSAARLISLSGEGSGGQNGAIERSGDVDMFRFVAPVSGWMTITQSARTGSTLDSLLTVYNASQVQIGSNDDGGGGRNSLVEVQVTAGATYYVKAAAYQTSTGAYTLALATDTTPPAGFSIELVISGMTAEQEQIFRQAARRWEQIITGDLPDASYGGQQIDDVRIAASAVYIDGPGNILGQAGPVAWRASGLPYYGAMEFDTADLAAMQSGGYLLPVIVHEMCHVLGFGTLWSNLGLIVGEGGADPRFVGALATAEYNTIFGTTGSVPVENTGGAGTRDGHWRESVFDNELMTGWVNVGRTNPISRITVASLADMGYQVNMAAADPYTRAVALGMADLAEAASYAAAPSSAVYGPWSSSVQPIAGAKRVPALGPLHDAALASGWQTAYWSEAGLCI